MQGEESGKKKNRGGVGGDKEGNLHSSPPPPPLSPYFFSRSLQFLAILHYLKAWTRLVEYSGLIQARSIQVWREGTLGIFLA